jgi:rare lipoprotein A
VIPRGAYRMILLIAASAIIAGCASTHQSERHVALDALSEHPVLQTAQGLASFYNNKFHGRKTASGERYDKTDFTAAHRDYPFGTYVRVTSKETGNSVIVRINDRGPLHSNRVIDVSRAAAVQLGMLRAGITRVTVDVLEWGT